MITADLEAKLIDALEAAINNSPAAKAIEHQITGAWSVTTDTVKAMQAESTVVLLAVALSLPRTETYTTPAVTFDGSLAMTVRFDRDPSGAALLAYGAVLESLFRSWQAQTYQTAFTALDLDTLSVDEVSIGGAPAPTFDPVACEYSLTLSFTLSGSYRS